MTVVSSPLNGHNAKGRIGLRCHGIGVRPLLEEVNLLAE